MRTIVYENFLHEKKLYENFLIWKYPELRYWKILRGAWKLESVCQMLAAFPDGKPDPTGRKESHSCSVREWAESVQAACWLDCSEEAWRKSVSRVAWVNERASQSDTFDYSTAFQVSYKSAMSRRVHSNVHSRVTGFSSYMRIRLASNSGRNATWSAGVWSEGQVHSVETVGWKRAQLQEGCESGLRDRVCSKECFDIAEQQSAAQVQQRRFVTERNSQGQPGTAGTLLGARGITVESWGICAKYASKRRNLPKTEDGRRSQGTKLTLYKRLMKTGLNLCW